VGYKPIKIEGKFYDESIYIKIATLISPIQTIEFNFKKRAFLATQSATVNYELNSFEFIYKEARASDGKNIPMLITKLKSTPLQNAAVLLSAYGGYGLFNNQHFSCDYIAFILQGGVYINSYIRGGGELGENWHKEGSGKNKSQCFRDFLSCAEYLISNEITKPSKLAIIGASHGGLVAAVALTKHPEFFRAAVIESAPVDLKKILLTVDSQFKYNEYGNPNISEELDSIKKYDPIENIRKLSSYPSTLVIANKLDARVNAGYNFKFIAAMQKYSQSKNPMLLYYNNNVGHYGNLNTYDDLLEYDSKVMKFIMAELDL
jgi:prolyl oligopeptidase